ncbi:MAG: hypothetical protein A2V90_06100 [Gammaproteobacteria bacterium RBG_16_57_12]|nr:MAG: hypothetical protein A2V90_06100 [Gammaproteobacteria bacterium RBG_16_57_12]
MKHSQQRAHYSAGILLAVLLALTLPALADFNPATALPEMGDAAGAYLSPAEEKQLGREFMRELRRSVKIIDDPEIELYVQNLGQRLASYLKNQNYEYKFFVIDNPAINAFAAPDGYIGINSGLILATQSEGELASVIAHEIAHINQHHLARQLEHGFKTSLPTLAAIIAAVLLSSQGGDASYAAISAGVAGSAQMQLNFTRANEQEADRVGIQLLAGAGFSPYGMTEFFSLLQQRSKYGESAAPEFLRTHPLTISRISDSMSRAEQYPHQEDTSSLNYHFMRQRLQAATSSNPAATASDMSQLLAEQQYLNEYGQRYGLAYALLLGGDLKGAEEQINKLISDDQDRATYQSLRAEIAQARRDFAGAAKIYDEVLKIHPGNKWLTLRLAEALLHNDQPAQARTLLYGIFRERETTPHIYKLLAQSENALGSQVEAHLSLAEYYYLSGYTVKAIEQLELALNQYQPTDTQSDYLKKRIEQLKAELIIETPAPDRYTR